MSHVMGKWARCLLLCGLIGSTLKGAAQPDAGGGGPSPNPSVRYQVSVNGSDRVFSVSMTVQGLSSPNIDFAMPRWTPGFYSVDNFSRLVRDLTASSPDGKTLAVEKPDANTWRIDTKDIASVTISYKVAEAADVFGTEVQGSSLDPEHPLINGTTVFGYVAGKTGLPIRVDFKLPTGWKVATSLQPVMPAGETTAAPAAAAPAGTEKKPEPAKPSAAKPSPGDSMSFDAPDYDTLVDSPFVLGKFQRMDREVAVNEKIKTQLSLVASGSTLTQAEWDKLTATSERIVKKQMELMQDSPGRYMYIFRFVNGAEDRSLEHANSSVIVMSKDRLVKTDLGAYTLAHMFFHTWNGKRIRPDYFQTINYSQVPDRPLLWFHEGFTHYYAYLTLVRSGIWTPRSFYIHLANRDETSIYQKRNALLGLVFSVRMRDLTHNQKGLDDLMRLLNERFGKTAKPYNKDAIVAGLNELAGTEKAFDALFDSLVVKQDTLPLDTFLALAGLRRAEKKQALPGLRIEIRKDPVSGRPEIASVAADSSEAKAGLQNGDLIVAIDGTVLEKDVGRAQKLAEKKPAGTNFEIRVWRPSDKKAITAKGVAAGRETTLLTFEEIPDAKELPVLIREGIIKASNKEPVTVGHSGFIDLKVVYYQDTDKGATDKEQFNKPIGWTTYEKEVANRPETQVNFSYQGDSVPYQGMRPTYWSAKFSGKLYVRDDGEYVFHLDNIKDGAKLSIDDKIVLDSWLVRENPAGASSSPVKLTGGMHNILIEYAHGTGNASLSLSWTYPITGKQLIPQGTPPKGTPTASSASVNSNTSKK